MGAHTHVCIHICAYIQLIVSHLCETELFEIELFLTLKLHLHLTELFNIELFWHLTVCKQNLYLYGTKLAELELLD